MARMGWPEEEDDGDDLDDEAVWRRLRMGEHLEAVTGFLAFGVVAAFGIAIFTALTGNFRGGYVVAGVALAAVTVALWRVRRRLPSARTGATRSNPLQ